MNYKIVLIIVGICLILFIVGCYLEKKQLKLLHNLDLEIKENNKKISLLIEQHSNLQSQYQKLLAVNHKIKIIQTSTKEAFEEEYFKFWNSKQLSNKQHLWNIFNAKETSSDFTRTSFLSVIEYDTWELKDGYSEENYRVALDEFTHFNKTCNSEIEFYENRIFDLQSTLEARAEELVYCKLSSLSYPGSLARPFPQAWHRYFTKLNQHHERNDKK